MTTRFEKARFHIKTGPRSLFERVKLIIGENPVLKLHAPHLKKRLLQREISSEDINVLQQGEWELMTAEVRVDKGKFVNCAWRKPYRDSFLWVVIGFGETVETVILKDGDGLNDQVVTSGGLYDFVDEVNRDLMAENRSSG